MRNISSSLQRCPGCGAMVSFSFEENKTVCPFCGVELLDKDKNEKAQESESLLQRAYDHEAAGNVEKALHLCEKALDLDASNEEAKHLHARLVRMVTKPNLKISCRSEGKRRPVVRVSVDNSKWMTVSASAPLRITLQPGEHSLFFRSNRDYERTIYIKDKNTSLDVSFVLGNAKNRIDISGDLEKDSKPHKKRPIYKQWWVYLVGGMLILTLIGSIVGGDEQPEEPVRAGVAAEESKAIEEPFLTEAPTIPEPTQEPTQEQEPSAETGYVNADSLRLRAEPNTESDVLGEYKYGQSVEIMELSGDWYKVIVDGKEGYMSAEYVGRGEAPAREDPPENAQQAQTNMISSGEVWIPQSEGGKYHRNPDCSGMANPIKITLEEAQDRGIEACKRCY